VQSYIISLYDCVIKTVSLSLSDGVLLVAKILESLTKIKSLLPGLACRDKFGSERRQREIVLPRDKSTMRVSVSLAQICDHPFPQLIWVLRATGVSNKLIGSVTEISKNVVSRLHVCDARNSDILAELSVRPSKIRAGYSDEVAKTSYNATVATVEVWYGVDVVIVF